MAGKEPRITKQLAGKLSNYLRSVDAQRPILRKLNNWHLGRMK